MRETTSRLLSTLLVLCMVLALLPGTVLAEETLDVNYDTIEIYVENQSAWMDVKNWSFWGEYNYGLFDLEGDGIPEVFVTQVQGSGHFSVNYYYKIDAGTRSVYEIKEYPDGWDAVDLDYCLKIYRDNQTNQLFYYSYDYARAGADYYGMDYSFLYIQNGVASIKPLWGESHNGASTEFYYFTDGEDRVKVSESEWKRYQEEYLDRYTLLAESVPTISSTELNKANGEQLSELLRGMYDELYQSIGATPDTPSTPAIPTTGTAYPSTQTVDIDGTQVTFQMYALRDDNGGETNYIKVRDLALAMSTTKAPFDVLWDGVINLVPGNVYKATGTENSTPFSGNRTYKAATDATNVDGEASNLSAFILTDDAGGDYTYYQLRDLACNLGFNVSWSQERGVFIESDEPYSELD